MGDNGQKKIVIEKIIAEETRKVAERLGHFNHLDLICLKRNLAPDEFIKVYEGTLRNIMKLCESRLKNSFSRKERYGEYGEKQEKSPRLQEQEWLERINQNPYPIGVSSVCTRDPNLQTRKGGKDGRK